MHNKSNNKYEVVNVEGYRVELVKYGNNDWSITDVHPEISDNDDDIYGNITSKAVKIAATR